MNLFSLYLLSRFPSLVIFRLLSKHIYLNSSLLFPLNSSATFFILQSYSSKACYFMIFLSSLLQSLASSFTSFQFFFEPFLPLFNSSFPLGACDFAAGTANLVQPSISSFQISSQLSNESLNSWADVDLYFLFLEDDLFSCNSQLFFEAHVLA